MPRQPRLVVPGHPYHVTQRGNRRESVFFEDADYAAYLRLLSEWAGRAKTDIWAYCLMPNHVHLVLVPSREDGLRVILGRRIGDAWMEAMEVRLQRRSRPWKRGPKGRKG